MSILNYRHYIFVFICTMPNDKIGCHEKVMSNNDALCVFFAIGEDNSEYPDTGIAH